MKLLGEGWKLYYHPTVKQWYLRKGRRMIYVPKGIATRLVELNYMLSSERTSASPETLKWLIGVIIDGFDPKLTNEVSSIYDEIMRVLGGGSATRLIVVSRIRDSKNLLRVCGIACSIGCGNIGVILVNDDIWSKLNDASRRFILAHETIHIVKCHVITKALAEYIVQISVEATADVLGELIKAQGLLEFLIYLGLSFIISQIPLNLVKKHSEIVRAQELEADELASKAIGCVSAKQFKELLVMLKDKYGDLSHAGLLGYPALTISERIKNIDSICS